MRINCIRNSREEMIENDPQALSFTKKVILMILRYSLQALLSMII